MKKRYISLGLGAFAVTMFSGTSLQAGGCLNKSCETLGYAQSEEECSGSKYIRCPFNSTKYFCNNCGADYVSECSGAGYIGGIGRSCNAKFKRCACQSGYKWQDNQCISKACSEYNYQDTDTSTEFLICKEVKPTDDLTCYSCSGAVSINYKITYTIAFGNGPSPGSLDHQISVISPDNRQAGYKTYNMSSPSGGAGKSVSTDIMPLVTSYPATGPYKINIEMKPQWSSGAGFGICYLGSVSINGKCWGSTGINGCPGYTDNQGSADDFITVTLPHARGYLLEINGYCDYQ